MTDNEIIKALKCCTDEQSCYECIYRLGMAAQCMDNLMRDALTLINRQKSEIEILKEKNNCSTHLLIQSDNFINRQKAEIEKLKTDFQIEASDKLEKEIRAEAIKGFAERLKNHLRQQPKWCINRDHYRNVGFSYDDVFFGIDHILKEMTEGENG